MPGKKISIAGPYPECPSCDSGNLIPVRITNGYIYWKCSNCDKTVSKI